MATKIKNAIMYLFCFAGTILIMLGGAALDSEDIVLPIKVCSIGIVLLLISVMLNSKSK